MEDELDAAPVAPAAEPVHPSTVIDAMTPVERDTWRKTGAFPGDEPAPAREPGTPNPEPPTPAAAAPVVPAVPVSKRQQQINDLIRERATSDQRVKALEAELEAARRTPATQPAREPATPPAAAPVEPKIDDFLSEPDPWAAFTKASGRYEIAEALRVEREAQATRDRQSQSERAFGERANSFMGRVKSVLETRPDYLEVTASLAATIHPQSLIGEVLTESAVGPQLLLHLAEHLDDYEQIQRAPSSMDAQRALLRLEARLLASSAPAAAAQVIKHVTSAPPPPPTLGTRSTEPVDEVEAAGARGDFRAYREAANRRDLAARR